MRAFHCCVIGLLGMHPLLAQSALGQLESMTGQKVQRFQGSSAHRYSPVGASTARSAKPPQLTPDQRAASLLAGVFGGVLAQARLQRMMAENGDLKVLGQRSYELEDQLSRLKEEAAQQGSDGRALAREHEAWGAQVDRAVQNSLERGVSLLTGTIIPEGTAGGLKTLRGNPAVWNGTLEALSQVHDFTDFVTERGDRVLAAREAVDWVQAKRNLNQDLDFIATNLQHVSKAWKPLSTQWELGKNIVGSGLDVAQELNAWGNMNSAAGDQQLLKVRQQALKTQMTALVTQLQASRGALATQLGVRPEDLIPVVADPKGLAKPVPRL